MNIEEKIQSLGFTLPDAPASVGLYENAVLSGNLLHLSGGIPTDASGQLLTGKVPTDASVEDAQFAAQQIILNRLAVIKEAIGSLDKVERIVAINGFVNSAPDFYDHPKVINAASQLLIDIFGDKGRHSRTALGAAALPLNVQVEINMIVEVQV